MDEKLETAKDLISAIDGCLIARGQAEHDAALQKFMDALEYYIERQQQSWVK